MLLFVPKDGDTLRNGGLTSTIRHRYSISYAWFVVFI